MSIFLCCLCKEKPKVMQEPSEDVMVTTEEEQALTSDAMKFCPHHKHQVLDMYCFDCQTKLCSKKCQEKEHKSHNCTALKAMIANQCAEKLGRDVAACIGDLRMKVDQLDKEQKASLESIKKAEDDVTSLKQHANKQCDHLLNQLEKMKTEAEEDFNKRRSMCLAEMEELKTSNADTTAENDVGIIGDVLQKQAHEPLKNATVENCGALSVQFTPMEHEHNIIGYIDSERRSDTEISSGYARASPVTPTVAPTQASLNPAVDLSDRYIASMVLSGVGDALGFHGGHWEFCKDGGKIQHELRELGGLTKITVASPGWRVSDDTVMHLATARALVLHGSLKPDDWLFREIAREYKACMKYMDGRAPGNTCMSSTDQLRPDELYGYKTVRFNEWHGGCGAAMRAMCIGLRYPNPKDLDALIAVSIESGRMTHNCPRGFLGSLAAALFVHYAIQGIPLKMWGARLVTVLEESAWDYIQREGREVEENKQNWRYFVNPWKNFLKIRGIQDGISEPKFDKDFHNNIEDRHRFYQQFTKENKPVWPGACGHDAPMIAYDALLCAKGNWEILCNYGMFHGGDSDSTGVIAGACFGALYGFTNVPDCNHKKLEFRNQLESLGKTLWMLGKPEHTGATTLTDLQQQDKVHHKQGDDKCRWTSV